MGIVPKDKGKRINWYKVRLPVWAQDPQGIGSTPERIAELAAIVEEARLARVEQRRAQQAARTATQRLHQAMKKLSTHGASVISGIRTKGGRGGKRSAWGDPAVYVKASMPMPRRKSRLPAPGKPYELNFQLRQIGWLTLSWKCDNAANAVNTLYVVSRQLNGAGEFEVVGTAGKKTFTDENLPAGGASVVTYRVQAQRSTRVGEPAELRVSFGSAWPGAAVAALAA